MRPMLTVNQVKESRQRAWDGEIVKYIARDMGLPYRPTWSAIRGITWSSIASPKPIPDNFLVGGRQPVNGGICINCGRERKTKPNGVKSGSNGRCGACASYYRRNGRERPSKLVYYRFIPIETALLKRLYRRYQAWESVREIADDYQFSESTLTRRFKEAGFQLRGRFEARQTLTAAIVRQVRKLAHDEGVSIGEIAEMLNVPFTTIYDAIVWKSWRSAGGTMPTSGVGSGDQPCAKCEILTSHSSGLCRFCRSDDE